MQDVRVTQLHPEHGAPAEREGQWHHEEHVVERAPRQRNGHSRQGIVRGIASKLKCLVQEQLGVGLDVRQQDKLRRRVVRALVQVRRAE